ncbi:MAG: hypothetical protein AMJ46_12475 [Latescibacteria bacterium DG_63]|nr:MAG: hypothetical protein AMJ46_12475 [Latescibacteria bacterium DG_63]
MALDIISWLVCSGAVLAGFLLGHERGFRTGRLAGYHEALADARRAAMHNRSGYTANKEDCKWN